MSNHGLKEIYNCIHCGMCLSECPTYRITGLETESPRGRIHLARAVEEDRIEPGEAFSEHMYLCLGCRACESACPSGVKFGAILERSRELVGPAGSGWKRFFLRLSLERLFPYPGRLRLAATLLRLYQRSPLKWVVRRLAPKGLRKLESMLPDVPSRFFSANARVLPAIGVKRARVGFLSGCVTSVLLPDMNDATVRVLRIAGAEVVIPGAQTCCGALNLHNGESRFAREMARRNIGAFARLDVDAVVVNSAGCGSTLKEYVELLGNDPDYAAAAREFSSRVKDISEFLFEIEAEAGGANGGKGANEGGGGSLGRALGRLDLKVTYQDPCHLVHGQKISKQPRALLRSIPGVELVEMAHPTRCCGSAGVYNVLEPEMSEQVLDEKVRDIAGTGSDVVVAPNPGCMLQLGYGLREHGVNAKVLHIVELLDMACRKKEASGD